jgi:hypothetical protein
MKEYKHTQIGYLLLILYSAVLLFIGYLNIVTGFNPFALAGLIIMLIVLGLFATLTVAVDDQMIKIQFGLGVIRKGFRLKDIRHYIDLDGLIMPRSEVQSEIVQPTASFHYFITEILFPISYFVFNNAIPFHATNGMFDPYSDFRNEAIVVFVVCGQLFAPRFLFWLDNGYSSQGEPLKAGILI